MTNLAVLKGKKILVVDDEPDVLELVKEALPACEITTCSTFESALDFINNHLFDLAILDIMGVNGFDVLQAARKRKIPAAMLTAHSLNVESLNTAIKLGAVSFLPKEELQKLPTLVAEILEDLAVGRTHWESLFKRLGGFFKERLGVVWEEIEQPPTHLPRRWAP